jgi:hypothetical protein
MDNSALAEINQEQRRPRGPGRPFEPGRSGNPGGRPRDVGNVRELAREFTQEAVETLVDIMRTGKTDSARAAAASELLSRGWGKPSLPIRTEPSPIIFTDEQLQILTDGLRYLGARAVPSK